MTNTTQHYTDVVNNLMNDIHHYATLRTAYIASSKDVTYENIEQVRNKIYNKILEMAQGEQAHV